MDIRIGLYDFFSFTVPGGVYLFTILYIFLRTKTIQPSQQLQDFLLSATGILLITIASYVSGLIFDFFTSRWVRLFRSKNFSQKILDEFRARSHHLNIKFQASDWPILIAKIRQDNTENGVAIEQNNVTNLMLRNLSFGFAAFSLVQLVDFFVTDRTINIILFVFFALLSGFAQAQSTKFARFFFIQIFEYTVAKDLSEVKLSEYKLSDQPTTKNKQTDIEQSEKM